MIVNPKLISVAAGLLKPENETKKQRLERALENNNLDVESVVGNLRNIAYGAEKDETRLKANEMAAKLNGLLQDEKVSSIPVINIVIQGDGDVNAVLMPPQPVCV
jgi:hypothetical protein